MGSSQIMVLKCCVLLCDGPLYYKEKYSCLSSFHYTDYSAIRTARDDSVRSSVHRFLVCMHNIIIIVII